jgi:hypothetical protein
MAAVQPEPWLRALITTTTNNNKNNNNNNTHSKSAVLNTINPFLTTHFLQLKTWQGKAVEPEVSCS